MANLFTERILGPLKALLTEGLTPAKLATALAAGLVLGVTPMLGISSVLAVAIAYSLNLNQIGIQLGNYGAYPLQIILFIPFIRTGEWLLGLPPAAINPSDIAMMFNDDPARSLGVYGASLASAFMVWLILAVPTAWLLRFPLRWALQRYGPSATHRD